MDWQPFLLTLKLATATTATLFLVALPAARWLARTRSPWRPVVEALIGLPLVLPPTVLGFYLLLAFGPENALGGWLDRTFGLRLVFSFPGLLIASMLYSLPFMVQPIRAGLAGLPKAWEEASGTLGKSPWTTFFQVSLPNVKPSLLTAAVLTFAHTVGEFGVVLMIGGNIPGRTRVASIAVYDAVESLDYASAHQYAAVLLLFSFAVLFLTYTRGLAGSKTLWP